MSINVTILESPTIPVSVSPSTGSSLNLEAGQYSRHAVAHRAGNNDELDHNLIANLQGGSQAERFHLTEGEVNLIYQNSGNVNAISGEFSSQISTLQTATGVLRGDIDSNDSDIFALQTATGVLRGDIYSNDSDILNLQIATGNLDTRVTQNTIDIFTVSGLLSNDALTDIVFQTGDQLISGFKTFEDDLTINANANLTGNLSINGLISTVDSIQFNTLAGETVGQGQFAWNSEDLTMDLGLDTNVTLQLGQEQVIRVKCADPLGVFDGMPVYAYGTTGGSDNIEIKRYSSAADYGVDELYFIGIATEDIAFNGVGFVTTFGRVREVDGRAYGINNGVKDPADTSNWGFGDVLYVSPNIAGTLTKIIPESPDARIPVAMVLKAPNQSNITLMVRAEHGYHLTELHDVYARTPSDGQTLIYNAANERWENTTLDLSSYAEISFVNQVSGDLNSSIESLQNQTGNYYLASNPSGFITGVDLSSFATTSFVTGVSGFLENQIIDLNNQTGNYYTIDNPSGYITGLDLSNYSTIGFTTGISGYLQNQIIDLNNATGNYYLASNPSGYITGVDLSDYVTGDVIRPSDTGIFYTNDNPSGFITGVDLSSYAEISFVTGVSGDLNSSIQILESQTGDYYQNSNPSGFITGVDQVSFVTLMQTGIEETGIQFPYTFAAIPRVLADMQLVSDTGYLVGIKNVTATGYTAIFSDIIEETGLYLHTFAINQ